MLIKIVTKILHFPVLNFLGGFDLQEDPSIIVEHLLSMLHQLLLSHQDLSLDESLKIYVNVLSLDHMNFNQNIKKKCSKKKIN